MILKASQRAGGSQLARHLMNVDDNDHVELHELRGFVAETLEGAFQEAYAISRGTRCRQFLFSLSLSPPETERVPIEVFEKTIEEIEARTGLCDQPRAIVFHEKEGRRHAHCVWSRIDMERMTAINLSHYKYKLRDLSRELYIEHGWQMPRGFENSAERDPLSFSLIEWQQAKRAKQDPRVIKQMFQKCWQQSDSVSAFAAALKERGFWLARGDRRGHVAVDRRGEVYAISRWSGIKAKEARARLGYPSCLPSVEDTKTEIAARYSVKLKSLIAETENQYNTQLDVLTCKRAELVETHRIARKSLDRAQTIREIRETKERSANRP